MKNAWKMRFSCVVAVFLFSYLAIAADKTSFSVVYSGNTQSALYPAKVSDKWIGGVNARANLIAKLKKQDKNLIAIEGPGSIAGALSDMNSVNEDLDKKRALVYFNILKSMGYDVVCLGADDFERIDYLTGWKPGPVNVLSLGPTKQSAGFNSNRIQYVDTAGIKIGFMIAHNDWINEVSSMSGELRGKGADLVAMVISDGVDAQLLAQKKDDILASVDMLFLPQSNLLNIFSDDDVNDSLVLFLKDTNTVVFAPKWGGYALSFASISVEEGKIIAAAIESKKVIDNGKMNKSIKKLLPACFSDSDCKSKAQSGQICQCVSPGTMQAKCDCAVLEPYELTAIVPRRCLSCNETDIASWMNDIFKRGVKINRVYMDTPNGQEIINSLKAMYLPIYLLPDKISKDKHFYAIKESLMKTDYGYMIKPEAAGVSVYVNRQRIPKKLDVFVNPILESKGLAQLVKRIHELRQQLPDWDISINYIVKADRAGNVVFANNDAGKMEAIAQLCIEKYSPDLLSKFSSCRFIQGYPNDILPCLTGAENTQILKIRQCLQNPTEISYYLNEKTKLSLELNIDKPGVVLFENQQVLSLSPRILTPENLKVWSGEGANEKAEAE